MNLLDELKKNKLGLTDEGARVRCRVSKDNTGVRFIASVPGICMLNKLGSVYNLSGLRTN